MVMSEKTTRISENIRTSDENEYKKGDLLYARNRTIGAGTESEDEVDATEMARRKQMYGGKGRYKKQEEPDSEIGRFRKMEYGKSDSGNMKVNKGRQYNS